MSNQTPCDRRHSEAWECQHAYGFTTIFANFQADACHMGYMHFFRLGKLGQCRCQWDSKSFGIKSAVAWIHAYGRSVPTLFFNRLFSTQAMTTREHLSLRYCFRVPKNARILEKRGALALFHVLFQLERGCQCSLNRLKRRERKTYYVLPVSE